MIARLAACAAIWSVMTVCSAGRASGTSCTVASEAFADASWSAVPKGPDTIKLKIFSDESILGAASSSTATSKIG